MCSNFITIPDDYFSYRVEHFSMPDHYAGDLESVIIPFGLIRDRVEKLAFDIFQDYAPLKEVTLVCILKGGHRFFADITDAIQIIVRNRSNGDKTLKMVYEFIQVQSYQNECSGEVKIKSEKGLLNQLKESISGKDVLIVEDIIDSGKTMIELKKIMHEAGVQSLKVASLLVKRTPLSSGFKPDYIGFEVPNKFIVGYNLDFNQNFRDLNHICLISTQGKQKYTSPENGK